MQRELMCSPDVKGDAVHQLQRPSLKCILRHLVDVFEHLVVNSLEVAHETSALLRRTDQLSEVWHSVMRTGAA